MKVEELIAQLLVLSPDVKTFWKVYWDEPNKQVGLEPGRGQTIRSLLISLARECWEAEVEMYDKKNDLYEPVNMEKIKNS